MIRIERLDDKDFETIEHWNDGKSKDFLVQWAGQKYEHPLTAAFLQAHHAGHSRPGAETFIYRIMLDDEMIGTVQLLKFDAQARSAIVGRFLIGKESTRGKGYGAQALKEIVKIGFEQFGLATIKLNVFDFNKGAIKCYENAGFEITEFEPDAHEAENGASWGLCRMQITSYQWKAAEGC